MIQKKGPLLQRSLQISLVVQKLFSCLYRSFSELFEVLHEFQSCLTCASASCFVSLLNLSVSVDNEELILCLDFLDKCFHDFSEIKIVR